MNTDPIWTLNYLGYDLTYPRTKSAHLLMKSEIIKNSPHFTSEEWVLAESVYYMKPTKRASAETLKEKVIKAFFYTEAEKESKNISSTAKKGLQKMAKGAGLKEAQDFVALSQSASDDLKKDPLYQMLLNKCKGKSQSELSTTFGEVVELMTSKNFKKASSVLGVEEKTLLFYVASEGGKKDIRPLIANALKSNKAFGNKRAVKDFPSFTEMANGIKVLDFFTGKAYKEVWYYFKEAISWFKYDELPDFEIAHPIQSTDAIIETTFWNTVRSFVVEPLIFIKTLPQRACSLFSKILEEGWIGVFSDPSVSLFILGIMGYYVFIAMSSLGLYLLKLPGKILIEWPAKLLWLLIKKIVLGTYKLGKYAYKFVTEEEVRMAASKYFRDKYEAALNLPSDIAEGLESVYDKAHEFFTSEKLKKEYLQDPDDLLEQMV